MAVAVKEDTVRNWHQQPPFDVLAQLSVDLVQGLSEEEWPRRLVRYGENELIETGLKSPWQILWEQLTARLVVMLIVAAVIAGLLGNYKDTIAILAIVILNALLGFIQEYRAEQAIAALKKLAVPSVRVRRGGLIQEISAQKLVPGDIVLLESGNLVPADCRVLESASLRIEEAALTGESEPSEKVTDALPEAELQLGDRRNMAYMGTVVTYGRGQVVVTETGMATELGRIAAMIQSVKPKPTPLQTRLDQLGKKLAVAAITVAALIFVFDLLRGEDLKLMFLTAISIVVAVVPEGLPAVVTIALALGVQRMLKRQALIRKLPSVEALGSVTVICSDKTGTLTENRMTVTVLDVLEHRVELSEELRHLHPLTNPHGDHQASLNEHPALAWLLVGGALCNDAVLKPIEAEAELLEAVGDPTESALVVAAAQFGLAKGELEQLLPRVAEVPFDSQRKCMSTVHEFLNETVPTPLRDLLQKRQPDSQRYITFTKGALDSLLHLSVAVQLNYTTAPLDDAWRRRIAAAHDQLAQNGMRVLGVAMRPIQELPTTICQDELEQELVFVGLIGIIDPPRQEVKQAVQTCQTAGIRPVMITGDHPLTAGQIARELGIATDGRVLTGQELARMSVRKLEEVVNSVAVYARVSPEHKLKIVEALQNQGQIVAMTGDGVNDAPALRKADIGVAMGITGTDVAKEAAGMVLLNDNFATIVAAVEEGRAIYDNIRKFIKFSITGNVGKILAVMVAPLLGLPPALQPLQILWLNLLTDGLLGLGLSVEPGERGLMHRRPFDPNESIFSRGIGIHILWMGTLIGFVGLGTGYIWWRAGNTHWQTMLFSTLALAQVSQVMAVRGGDASLFSLGVLSNKPLLGIVAMVVLLQLLVVYVPFLQRVFQTEALPPLELALSFAVSALIFWSAELEKWIRRRKQTEA